MTKDYEILKWDTDFFGFLVARINPLRLRINKLQVILDLLKKDGVCLAYWGSDPTDLESQRSALQCNGFLADKKETYEIDLAMVHEDQLNDAIPNIEEYTAIIPNKELISLAIQSGFYSRFNVDKQFPAGLFRRLYVEWISRSVDRTIADVVFVAKHEDIITGMITVVKKDNLGKIGLIAVNHDMRGGKIGTKLITAAQRWFVQHGCKTAQVTTQGDNIHGRKFYKALGYSIRKIEYLYHFWLLI